VDNRFRGFLALAKEEEAYLSRRNHAELGVGTNPNAKPPDPEVERGSRGNREKNETSE
jgi:hypothetical protein